jgi:hypothetical protein
MSKWWTRLLGLAVAFFLICSLVIGGSTFALVTPTKNATCKVKGQIVTAKQGSLICAKVGKKLLWQIYIKPKRIPAPAATFKATPTPTPTPRTSSVPAT